MTRCNRVFTLMTLSLIAIAAGCGGGGGDEAAPAGGEAAPSAGYFKVDPAKAATITGKINLEGDPPKVRPINMSAELDCKELHTGAVMPEVVVAKDGKLQNVFVWVKSGLGDKKFEVSSEPVRLNQKGCVYVPHVLGLQTNQLIKIANSDPMTHNVHPLPKKNREWNKSQSPGASELEYRFPRVELKLAVKCNIHPWMRSYIHVVEHPFFAVTGADGTFEIKGLPAGAYTIEAVHERLGEQEISVTVGDAESKDVELTFKSS